MVAWHGLTDEAKAQNNGGSGSWWTGKADFTVPVELDHDAVVDELWGMTALGPPETPGGPPTTKAVNAIFADKAALRAHFGWVAGGTTKSTFTQTLKWEEWLTKADGSGGPPDKFRKLSWEYSGNVVLGGMTLNAAGVPTQLPNNYGLVFTIEGYFAGLDKWKLGTYTIDPTVNPTNQVIINDSDATFWLNSGSKAAVQPGDQAKVKCGGNSSWGGQAILVEAAGAWVGTAEGVPTIEFFHGCFLHALMIAVFPNDWVIPRFVTGQTAGNSAAQLKVEDEKKAKIYVTDWQHNRELQTKDGTTIANGTDPHPYYPNTSATQNEWVVELQRASGTYTEA